MDSDSLVEDELVDEFLLGFAELLELFFLEIGFHDHLLVEMLVVLAFVLGVAELGILDLDVCLLVVVDLADEGGEELAFEFLEGDRGGWIRCHRKRKRTGRRWMARCVRGPCD